LIWSRPHASTNEKPRDGPSRSDEGHSGFERRDVERRRAGQDARARPSAREPDQRLQRRVDSGARHAKKSGETDERLLSVAAWRDAPYFTDAERSALALTEAVTRLSDRADPVPDAVWDDVAKHFDERAIASLILTIATTNLFNRLNVSTRQPAGAWG
jgi:hypothetical protein